YRLIAERPKKPVGDELDIILAQATGQVTTDGSPSSSEAPTTTSPKRQGFLAEIQRFFRALSS
ncbi:MAG: DUF1995 domain-containing protein, partial [Trichodesmium sp.]